MLIENEPSTFRRSGKGDWQGQNDEIKFMESARLKHDTMKSDPVAGRARQKRAPSASVARWPVTLNVAGPPALRLGNAFAPVVTSDLIAEKQPLAITPNQPAMIARQADGEGAPCTPGPGKTNSDCSAYFANAWWLPWAYVNNATCACTSTPNVPTANCVRKVLQDRLAATPTGVKVLAASQKFLESPLTYPAYQSFVQAFLTPRIYRDHVVAYRSCCCPSGPAPYPS